MRFLDSLIWIWKEGGLPCLFHTLTGLYCPGCGGTRAFKALIFGRPLLSFCYHPLVPYCAVAAVWFFGSYILYWLTGKEKYRVFLPARVIYVGIAIILINFLVKNYFLIWKGIDILEQLPKV